MKASELKKTIDDMVASSIRRQLPEIMSEVLMRTIANSGIISEQRQPTRQAPVAAQKPKSKLVEQLLSEGGDDDPYGIGTLWEDDEVSHAPKQQRRPQQPTQIAQRITSLPPELRELAEDTAQTLMHEERDGSGPDLRRANSAGFDFERMRRTIGITEQKAPAASNADMARYEDLRIKRMREKLDVKPGG